MALNDKKQTGKNTNWGSSLRHAVAGLCLAWREERNFRIHLLAALVVVGAALLLKVSLVELSILLLCILLVLAAEVVNTITENLVDLFTGGKYDIRAKRIKDLAAGGVLLAVLFAAIIGIIVFANKIW